MAKTPHARKSRVVTLAPDERFSYAGRRISSLKIPADVVGWNDWVSLRDGNGYVASATPGSSAEITNALASRGRLA